MTITLNQLHLYLVPVLSVLLSYIIGRLSNSRNLKIESLKERYYNFYLPYIQLLVRASVKFPTVITNPEIAIKFGELIIEKSHYLEKETSKYAIDYYILELNYLEYFDGNPDFPDAEEKINNFLIKVSLEILKESTKVAKQLKMPQISKPLYTYLLDHIDNTALM